MLIHLTLRDFSRSNGPNVAAGIAYFALLSIFPLMLATMAISGFFFTDEAEQLKIVDAIRKLVPVSSDFLSQTIEGVVNSRGTVSLIAALGLLWSGLTVFAAVRKGINHAWGIGKPPNLLKERLIDLSMMMGLALAGSVIFILSATLFQLPEIGRWLSVVGGGTLGKVVVSLISLFVSFVVLLLMYKYVPNRKVAWGGIWLGALVGAVFFEGSKDLFAWYVSNLGDFNLVYGSLGALMAILVWVYISALVLLVAAQLSAVYCRVIGSEAHTS